MAWEREPLLRQLPAHLPLGLTMEESVAFASTERMTKTNTAYCSSKNKKEIDRVLGKHLAAKPKSHWISILAEGGVPCAPVNDFADALSDPHVIARNMVVGVEHGSGRGVKQPGNPIKLSEHEDSFSPPPEVGQHTDEVLASWIDLSEDERAQLRDEGVI